MIVLVTGSNGQLGQSIQSISDNYPNIDFIFCDAATVDITDLETIKQAFNRYKPNFCINTAAYTAVDKAEIDSEKAHLINGVGAKNVAEVCSENNCTLVHISTDFVFDGKKTTPYNEEDATNPLGVYGQTKLQGEQAIQEVLERYYIIRTSWVYSQFGANFMKTMLRLSSERTSLSVVYDQIGTPTNAIDLAECLVKIIRHTELSRTADNRQPTTDNYGIYHFSNEGQCSWFDFAKKIVEVNGINIDLQPIPTSSYPTPAHRPQYSVLDKSKIKNAFKMNIKSWEDSLIEMQTNC